MKPSTKKIYDELESIPFRPIAKRHNKKLAVSRDGKYWTDHAKAIEILDRALAHKLERLDGLAEIAETPTAKNRVAAHRALVIRLAEQHRAFEVKMLERNE